MFKKNLKLALVALLVISSFSCDNFMDGTETLKNVDYQIWLANQVRPTVKILSPVLSSDGDYKNASIIFSFTKPMNPDTFEKAFTVKDSTGKKNFRENYGTASWNSDFTQVIIPAKEKNLLDITESLEITIGLSLELKDSTNVPIKETVSETFKLKSEVNAEKPVYIASNVSSSADIANGSAEGTLFINGELTADTQDNILSTNHIKNILYLYLEGHDYGDNVVFANISYKQLYTNAGKAVTGEEEKVIKELETTPEGTTNSASQFAIDLSDNNKFADGLYKVEIFLTDASNNRSDETKTYYIIRDTEYSLNSDAILYSAFPSWRNPNDEWQPEKKIKTLEEAIVNIGFSNFSDDIYLVYNNKTYKSLLKDSYFILYYGSNPDDTKKIEEPLSVWRSDNQSDYGFTYPEEVIDYVKANPSKDLYMEIELFDKVGNSVKRSAYFPKQKKVFNYTIDGNNVTLNYENTNDENVSKILKFSDYEIFDRTHILFGKKGASISESEIKRNFLYEYDPATPWEDFIDPWDSYSDKSTFTMDDPNAEYVAVIQTIYYYSRAGAYAGNTTTPIITVIDNISKKALNTDSNFANNITSITPQVTTEVLAKNTGLTKIKINNTDFNESGVTYYYGISTDNGQTWYYYPNNEFTINTPVIAPIHDWANIPWETISTFTNEWNNGIFYLPTNLTEYSYSTNVQVKAFAQKNNVVKESTAATLVFTEDEDNIPPTTSGWRKAYNLTMSADGTSYSTYNSPTCDTEWHDTNQFTYYYADYQTKWENSLDVLSTDEIIKLPHTNGKLLCSAYADDYDSPGTPYLKHDIFMKIPVNGLPDGDYMFFFTLADKYGNSTTKTLAKAHIGTFKNKLSVNYKDGKITASLPIEADEIFEENRILIQYFNTEETNPEICHWEKFVNENHQTGYHDCSDKILNFHCVNVMTKEAGKLTFTSGVNKTASGKDNFNYGIPENFFYKANVTSYNVDETSGIRIVESWIEDPEQRNGLDGGNHQFDAPGGTDEVYDAFTDETASYPVYFYIPVQENLNNFFEPSTVDILTSKPVLINVISSLRDLGNSVDEWERRGKTIFTDVYEPNANNEINFSYKDAIKKMYYSEEEGKRYFVVTAHFADNTSAISKTFEN